MAETSLALVPAAVPSTPAPVKAERAKASVAVSIIARNAEKTLGACLDSLVPYVRQVVVCVDETTTDKTAAVALRHGAKVVSGLRVSEWHECPLHGRVLAQDFAAARQRAFAELPGDVDWWLWVDADDVLAGGDRLTDFLARLGPEIDGVWLPYHYSRVTGGATSTLFDRERLLRVRPAGDPNRIEWEWQNRVHEVLRPKSRPTESLTWARTDQIRVLHQHEGHDTAGSAKRNILLLEIILETDPENQWAWFYLGNQWFALGEWPRAVECYERSTRHQNTYQLWQTFIYLSMAYEKLGDLANSRYSAWRAADAAPGHPEPYYRLAVCYMLAGDAQRAEFWTKMGDQQPDAPGFAFKNPLDRTFNARVTLGQAYGNAGRFAEAARELGAALQAAPSPVVREGVETYRRLARVEQVAVAAAELLEEKDDAGRLLVADRLALLPEVAAHARVRDLVAPAILRGRRGTQPRIVFWCGRSVEPWYPGSLGTGIGGSETAVIQIARRFARAGWGADVYNDCGEHEGVHDGVGYWDTGRLQAGERADLLVGWRQPGVRNLPVESRAWLLWCHDLNRGSEVAAQMASWDRVLGVSRWHARYLAQVYELTNTDHVPNGIDLARFGLGATAEQDQPPPRKVPFQCVYASSPDRGLETLLRLWPTVRAFEPAATLHVAYGWQGIDRLIQLGHRDLAVLRERLTRLIESTPGVVWRDRLGQGELARLYQESYAWVYPTTFTEVSCISAMEAMAGGCVPVTSAVGALPETIGDAGLVVTGNAYSGAWREFWLLGLRGVLASPDVRHGLARAGRERARGLTWDAAFLKWQEVAEQVLAGERAERREAVLA